MSGSAFRELLWPRAEKDPAFHAEIERLSVFGFRLIAVVSIAANVIGYLQWMLWNPTIPEWMAFSDLLAGAIVLVGVALTFWSKAVPYARMIALVILAIVAVEQLSSMMDQNELPIDIVGFVPAIFAITLFLTISALPVKPIHTVTLGGWMIGVFFCLSKTISSAPNC